jgi:2OG-Fe(II) oxygenase superfamily
MELIAATDHIFYVKNLLSAELCRSCIALYERDPLKHPGYTAHTAAGDRRLDAQVKVSTDLDIETDGAWAPVFLELHSATSAVIQSVAAQYPSLCVWPLQCTGYKLQHYKRNEGHFKWHCDSLGPGGQDRQLALVIYLNSVESGGETTFHRQSLKIKPVAGNAVLFPPFWTHMHCGEIPRSEDKFIISTFVRFDLPPIQ